MTKVFSTDQGYKEFIDAEQLMPMPTSDLRQPVCVELACLQRHPAPKALPEATPNSLDSPGQHRVAYTNKCEQLDLRFYSATISSKLSNTSEVTKKYPVVYKCS